MRFSLLRRQSNVVSTLCVAVGARRKFRKFSEFPFLATYSHHLSNIILKSDHREISSNLSQFFFLRKRWIARGLGKTSSVHSYFDAIIFLEFSSSAPRSDVSTRADTVENERETHKKIEFIVTEMRSDEKLSDLCDRALTQQRRS